jgi:hypothetical protein
MNFLCKKIIVAKSKEVKNGRNLAESSGEGCLAIDDDIIRATDSIIT